MTEIVRGKRFEDLCKMDSRKEKGKITFGEKELIPDSQVWVKVLGLIQECDTLVLVGKCEYSASPTMTWLYIIARVLNVSYRRDNPIKINVIDKSS